MLKRLMAFASMAVLVSGLVACNTVEGVGQDVQAGGKAVERAADKARK